MPVVSVASLQFFFFPLGLHVFHQHCQHLAKLKDIPDDGTPLDVDDSMNDMVLGVTWCWNIACSSTHGFQLVDDGGRHVPRVLKRTRTPVETRQLSGNLNSITLSASFHVALKRLGKLVSWRGAGTGRPRGVVLPSAFAFLARGLAPRPQRRPRTHEKLVLLRFIPGKCIHVAL
ncbi:uncharacterized protein J3D65DRAFT_620733 [Phyllosticta citribraziliensis]|uniref:Secreted protein n=1 Tax=Phyllosticta citribraziliensis TaxID=989973 RepID=A0ABR1LY15_9PEZI